MYKFAFAAIIALILSSAAFAQQVAAPTPTPSRNPADDDVVKISTDLIQLDVSVTDAKGRVVTDLRPDELELYVNGQKQKVTHFNFVSAAAPAQAPKDVKPDPLAIPLPPTHLRPEQVRRTFALVVDDLQLSFESAYQTQRALKKFVNEQMQEGDLVAIVRTGAGMGALQQFTSDKRLLLAAIEKVRWNPNGNAGISAFAPLEPTPMETLKATGDDTVSDEDIQEEKNRINANKDFQSSTFTTGTLGALKFVIEGMRELPGRKSVILMSDGFRLFERDEMGSTSGSTVLDAMRELIDVANRSSVVIYTIDARGLQSTFLTAQDQLADSSADAVSSAASDRNIELEETQDGLVYLAKQTGGFALINNNDLAGGVRKVMNDQSYYLVGYEPDADTFDRTKLKFNKFEIKVLRKGVTARYRSGFLNRPDVEQAQPAGVAAGRTPMAQLQNALLSPFGTSGIEVHLNALFGSDEKDLPFVRSLLHIKASDLKFTDGTGGAKKAVFDVLAMSFGDNGRVVDTLGKTYTLEVKGETLRKVMDEGFVYHFTFPVKKPGAYQYRVAIRDSQGGKVGSASQFIEVPNLKKAGLTLSSLVVESVTEAEWNRLQAGGSATGSDTMTDTAIRRVKIGSILRYGFEVYNAKLAADKRPQLQTQIRVFRDGKLVLNGTKHPFEMAGQTDMHHLKASGAITIGGKLEAGDYILQVVVTDSLASPKRQIATQFIEFEVVP